MFAPHNLEGEALPAGAPGRKAVAVAGDDPAATARAADLVDMLGFDLVVLGSLADGVRLEPGNPAFGGDVMAAELQDLVEAADLAM